MQKKNCSCCQKSSTEIASAGVEYIFTQSFARIFHSFFFPSRLVALQSLMNPIRINISTKLRVERNFLVVKCVYNYPAPLPWAGVNAMSV